MKPDSQYQPLLSDAPEDLVLKDEECCKDSDVAVPSRRQPIALWACIVLQTIVIVILAGFRLVQHPPTCPINPVFPQVLYCESWCRIVAEVYFTHTHLL